MYKNNRNVISKRVNQIRGKRKEIREKRRQNQKMGSNNFLFYHNLKKCSDTEG